MIKAAVLGGTGYAGQELVRLLVQHPHVQLSAVTSQTYAGKQITEVFPSLKTHTKIACCENDLQSIAQESDVVFLALPHGAAAKLVTSDILSKTKIIDLGGDFRFKNINTYEQWYHTEHGNAAINSESAYGLPEWHAGEISASRLIANPGCYATAASLALLPLVKNGVIVSGSIIVDAKSGVSGAGRAASQAVHYNECNETVKAYGLTTHRHTPEIEEQLSAFGEDAQITFTPHLVPMNRGILITAYAQMQEDLSRAEVHALFNDCYNDKPFVRLFEPSPESNLPETRWVKGSNFCDIGFAVDERNRRVIVVSALDNLVKGAAGQAIQNMNLMFGIEQTSGLLQVPLFPG